MRAYGAEIDFVDRAGSGDGRVPAARLERVRQLLAEATDAFWPNQYANLHNPGSHTAPRCTRSRPPSTARSTTSSVATSTCGTIRGCADYVREHGLRDAGGRRRRRRQRDLRRRARPSGIIPGHGAAVRPAALPAPIDRGECVQVTDLDCVVGCRRLVRARGDPGRRVVGRGAERGGARSGESHPRRRDLRAMFPDRGERYLDTDLLGRVGRGALRRHSTSWRESREKECTTATF